MAVLQRLGQIFLGQYRTALTLSADGDSAPPLLDTSGRLVVNVAAASGTASTGIPFYGDTVTRIAPTASNGATAVVLLAGVALQKVYCGTLVIYNVSTTVKHTLTLISSGGTVLLQTEIGAASATGASGFVLDGRGDIQTVTGEGLGFKFTDGTGSAADLVISGAVVQKA